MRTPSVLTWPWRVSDFRAAGACAGPYEVAIVVVDVRTLIEIAKEPKDNVPRCHELGS